MRTWLSLLILLALAAPAAAMNDDGCGAGQCNECHSLSVKEAAALLQKGGVERVLSVDFAEMPGIWEVQVEKESKRYPLYIDFSKSYVVAGNIIRLEDGRNVTRRRMAELNRVYVARIPLEDALLLGNPQASKRVIVFTDPECPYCKKLHVELKEAVRQDPDLAFLIKLFPLKMHPNAYDVSRSIVCNKSMELLEASFAGKPVPPPLCETPVVDRTIALVGELGIRSTPTLVMPDGRILPGFKKAADILGLLEGGAAPKVAEK